MVSIRQHRGTQDRSDAFSVEARGHLTSQSSQLAILAADLDVSLCVLLAQLPITYLCRNSSTNRQATNLSRFKLRLDAEVDESAWSALYSTKSQPFAPPASGKLAVKVINHYGDEVLKVLEVGK